MIFINPVTNREGPMEDKIRYILDVITSAVFREAYERKRIAQYNRKLRQWIQEVQQKLQETENVMNKIKEIKQMNEMIEFDRTEKLSDQEKKKLQKITEDYEITRSTN